MLMRWGLAEAMDADEMDTVKEMMDDYLDRNQDAFDDFEDPEEIYESIEHHMDNLEVCPHLCSLPARLLTAPPYMACAQLVWSSCW